MKLRVAENCDFKRISEIYEQVDKLHRKAHPDRFQKPIQIGRSQEYFNGLIKDDKAQLYVAIEKEEVIGFAEAYISSSADFPVLRKRQWLLIDGIAVDVKFRRKGVGQLLLNELYEWSKKQNIEDVELNVYAFNEPAIKFYKKNGFSEISKRMTKKL